MSTPIGSRLGIGSHTLPNVGATDDWITPREVLAALGEFDLDPCASATQPWRTAREMVALPRDGLTYPWVGRVWLNPPYGREARVWLERLAAHGDGVALIFARTETEMFVSQVWNEASAVLFLAGRLTFFRPDGTKPAANSGGPSCLVAYGERNVASLRASGLKGALVSAWEMVGA